MINFNKFKEEIFSYEYGKGNTLSLKTMENVSFELIFYKFLSEKLVKRLNDELEYDKLTFQEAYQKESYQFVLKEDSINNLGYFIVPSLLFYNLTNLHDMDLLNMIILINKYINNFHDFESRGLNLKKYFRGINVKSDEIGSNARYKAINLRKLIEVIENSSYEINYDEFSIDTYYVILKKELKNIFSGGN